MVAGRHVGELVGAVLVGLGREDGVRDAIAVQVDLQLHGDARDAGLVDVEGAVAVLVEEDGVQQSVGDRAGSGEAEVLIESGRRGRRQGHARGVRSGRPVGVEGGGGPGRRQQADRPVGAGQAEERVAPVRVGLRLAGLGLAVAVEVAGQDDGDALVGDVRGGGVPAGVRVEQDLVADGPAADVPEVRPQDGLARGQVDQEPVGGGVRGARRQRRVVEPDLVLAGRQAAEVVPPVRHGEPAERLVVRGVERAVDALPADEDPHVADAQLAVLQQVGVLVEPDEVPDLRVPEDAEVDGVQKLPGPDGDGGREGRGDAVGVVGGVVGGAGRQAVRVDGDDVRAGQEVVEAVGAADVRDVRDDVVEEAVPVDVHGGRD